MSASPPTVGTAAAAGPYAGRAIALATMHAKERAIAPVVEQRLGAQLVVPAGLDTDALGTFTGETERRGTMREVAVTKARMGMRASGLAIGLASEGSYGPHPHMPLMAGGIELMVLVDDERGLVVCESLLDDAPRYAHATVTNADELGEFLCRVGFPQHAVVVRPNRDAGAAQMSKGIRTPAQLSRAVVAAVAASVDGRALVQSDMRAHMHPSRMAVLGRLAARLADRLLSACPACGAPGFGQVGAEDGLPCGWCGGPTGVSRYLVLGCACCEHREHSAPAHGLVTADPAHCPACNP